MGTKSSVAECLRAEIRKSEKRGTSRYRLAQVSGVSEGQLSKIVHGKITPTLGTAEKIVRGMGLRIYIGPKK